jgi:hypothetical protein
VSNDFVEDRILYGIEYLKRVITCTDKQELTDLLIDHLWAKQDTAGDTGISAALSARDSYDPVDWNATDSKVNAVVEKFTFKGDDNLKAPNLGYAKWVTKGEQDRLDILERERFYDQIADHDMEVRKLGYVFWDKERFEGWEPKEIARGIWR